MEGWQPGWEHWVVLLLWLAYCRLCLKWPHSMVPAFIRQRRNWSKKCRHSGVRHISHRGGAGESLENTMEAFRHAVIDTRTDVIELDVHLTLDGVPVVCHDSNLRRLTGVDVRVEDVSFKELPTIKRELQVMSEPDGVLVNFEGRQQTAKLVSLEELFNAFPQTVFNIDLKRGSRELADKVAAIVFKKSLRERVIWGSDTDSGLTAYLHTEYPDISLFFGTRGVIKTVLLYWLGILPFVTLKESYFQTPYSWTYALRNHKSLSTTTWREWVKYQVLTFLFMQRSMFAHLSSRGIPVWMWIVNDKSGFDRAFKELKVDGVMTDYPARLRKYLKKNL